MITDKNIIRVLATIMVVILCLGVTGCSSTQYIKVESAGNPQISQHDNEIEITQNAKQDNKKNLFSKCTRYDSGGKALQYSTYEYDLYGNTSKVMTYMGRGTGGEAIYSYDYSDGKLCKVQIKERSDWSSGYELYEKEYDRLGNIVSYKHLEYDDDESVRNGIHIIYNIEYDSLYRLKKVERLDERGNVKHTDLYSYDGKGTTTIEIPGGIMDEENEAGNPEVVFPVMLQMSFIEGSEIVNMRPLNGQNAEAVKRMMLLDENKSKIGVLEFENGIVTLAETYNADGEMTWYFTYEHEYNSNGQVIKTTLKQNGTILGYCIYEY